MRGLYVRSGQLEFRDDLPEPPLGGEDSLLKVLYAGVCATDLALVRGYMGFEGIPGHEFVAEALSGPHAGKRVVGEINAGCGRCGVCAAGLGRHCPRRTVLGILDHGGVFAERASLPTSNLHVLPGSLSTRAAVFVEPLAAAFEIAEQIALQPDWRALVLGDGRLGLLCAKVLSSHGLEVTVGGRHPERARWLSDSIDYAHNLVEQEPKRQFDLAVEATGHPDNLPRILPWLKPRGKVVLKTTSERPVTLDLAPLVIDEIELIGSRCGPFEPAIAALAEGSIDVIGLIHAEYELARGVEAFAKARQRGTLKVLVRMESA